VNANKAPSHASASQTLVRGLQIIEAVIETPCTIPEIASLCGLTYSTAHRIISVLLARGYLRNTQEGRIGPGPKLLQLGFSAQQSFDVVPIAHPHLRQLADATLDTVHLAMLQGTSVLYLDKVAGQRPVEIRSSVGGKWPAIATGVGMAALFDQRPDVLRTMFAQERRSKRAGLTVEAWLAQMAEFKRTQIALDIGESEPSIRCVAAPVRDASSTIVAAVSVTSTVDYMPHSRMKKVATMVAATAAAISVDLGYRKAKVV